jgi:glucose/arabinose dehydrogenase
MRACRLIYLLVAALLLGCDGDGARTGTEVSPTPAREAERRSDEPVRADGDPSVEVITTGLEVPWDLAFLPDGRALVTERPGRVRLVGADGELRSEPVVKIDVEARGEGGLMGIDLDPRFGSGEPYAYAMVTANGEVQVRRLRWADGRLREEATILDGIVAGQIHDSGRLRFGPDERLHVVTGDAGDGRLSQQDGSRNGRVLALEPGQYRGSGPAEPEEISRGHRNPQGLDWQPGSDRLFVTEHGPSGFDGPSCCDELNLVREGGNYGWPEYGNDQREGARPAHLWQETIAPSGMTFVSLPGSAWTGDILVAALRGTALHRMEVSGTDVSEGEILLDGEHGRLRAVVEAPDGALWVTTSNRDSYGEPTGEQDDRIIRVVPPAA